MFVELFVLKWSVRHRVRAFCCLCDGVFRSTYPGDAAAGHATDAWQRVDAVLLRLLHLRHRRRPAVGRATAQPLLPRATRQRLRRRVSRSRVKTTGHDLLQFVLRGRSVLLLLCPRSRNAIQNHINQHHWQNYV